MSKKQQLFSNPFSFKGRIRRLEYMLSIFVIILFCIAISKLLETLRYTTAAEIITPIAYVIMLWFSYAQGAKRAHDVGESGWYQLIPGYIIWLIISDGDPYETSYGCDPKGRNEEPDNF